MALGEAGNSQQHAGSGDHERDEAEEHHDLPGIDPEAGADDDGNDDARTGEHELPPAFGGDPAADRPGPSPGDESCCAGGDGDEQADDDDRGVGASDDLASGRSTFMVEMTETAEILHNATARSLILLDEIGRGTSTFDGLSIAWAVAEYLPNSTAHSAKTLFATHYHELTELAENLPGAKNYQITAGEKDGEVVFFHKLQEGKASKSYGIAVARLAGLPNSVIERSKDVLSKLEQYELAVFADEKKSGLAKAAGGQA